MIESEARVSKTVSSSRNNIWNSISSNEVSQQVLPGIESYYKGIKHHSMSVPASAP